MGSSQVTNKDVGGCVLGMWSVFVTSPLWFATMYGALSAGDAPQWAWICFWAYLPSHLLSLMFLTALKFFSD